MGPCEGIMSCVELTQRDESSLDLQMSMVLVRSNPIDSKLSTEEDADFLLRLSSTSPAAHSINSGTNSFSFFSGFLVPADQRSSPCRLLEGTDESYDSVQSARTWDDEQCFERIMWSAKDISCDFLTACNDGLDDRCLDDRCQLSENWFQEDARHYDEQQKKKRAVKLELECLLRLDELEDLDQKRLVNQGMVTWNPKVCG